MIRRLGFVRRWIRWSNARRYLPDWTGLGIERPTAPRQRVLLATLVGGNIQAAEMERVLAAALTLRGSSVDTVLCDKALPACIQCSHVVLTLERMADHGPHGSMCPGCTSTGERAQRGTGSEVHHLSRWIRDDDRAEAALLRESTPAARVGESVLDGVPVGEHALAGTLRFLAVSTLPSDETTNRILGRYLEAAVIMCRASQRMLAELQPDVVVLQHGIYVPQGLVVQVAKLAGIRVVTWTTGYPTQSFLFSHDDTYHHTMVAETPEAWDEAPWDDGIAARTVDYLESRRSGSEDWISYSADSAKEPLETEPRPLVVAMANVAWDAQLHFEGRAFPTQREWIVATIEWARSRPDIVLMIRAHPAETSGYLPSRERLRDTVASCSPPENVRFIDADSPTSTYDLIDAANCVIVFGTKVGVEAAARSTPVITVGEAWLRNKGLSIDVETAEDYRAALDALPMSSLDATNRDRALRYAHHLFLRRMIPIRAFTAVEDQGPGTPLYFADVTSKTDLAPGADTGLDAICAGIAAGTPFIRDQLRP